MISPFHVERPAFGVSSGETGSPTLPHGRTGHREIDSARRKEASRTTAPPSARGNIRRFSNQTQGAWRLFHGDAAAGQVVC